MKQILKTNFRGELCANNAFIGSQIKLDEVISQLTEIRKNMKGCENWAHAESSCRSINELVEVVNNMYYLVDVKKQ